MISTTPDNIRSAVVNNISDVTLSLETTSIFNIILYTLSVVPSDVRGYSTKVLTFDGDGNNTTLDDVRVVKVLPVNTPTQRLNYETVAVFEPNYNGVDFVYDDGELHVPFMDASGYANQQALVTYLQMFEGHDGLIDSMGNLNSTAPLRMSKQEYGLVLLHCEAYVRNDDYNQNNTASGGSSSTTSGSVSDRSIRFGQFQITEKTDNRDITRTTTIQRTVNDDITHDVARHLLNRYEMLVVRMVPQGVLSYYR